MQAGLVSITFRKLSPRQIVDLVRRAGLEGIEWGGDVHVPHGDVGRAREVRKMTADAGLAVTAYGSYYHAGHDEPATFEAVLETAAELRAPIVRVWAGGKGSADADAEYRARVIDDTRRIADQAARAGVDVAFEFHGGTLTDTGASARELLGEVAGENVKSYWQPPRHVDVGGCLSGLEAVLGWLVGLHVFTWDRLSGRRLPLADGREDWMQYLRKAAVVGDLWALIEFVCDDDPAAFGADAASLKLWLSQLGDG